MKKAGLFSLLFFIFYVFNQFAIDGDLDTTFGTGGIVTTAITGKIDRINKVAIQDDGKIVVAGFSDFGGPSNWQVARYTSAGVLDTTFGIGGFGAIPPLATNGAEAEDIVIQPDGKIVVVGVRDIEEDPNFVGLIVRYNTNGSIDTETTLNLAAAPVGGNRFFGVTLRSNGKIVVTGQDDTGGNPVALVAQFLSDAVTIDNSFGSGTGLVSFNTAGVDDQGNAVVVQEDGRILVVGTDNTGGTERGWVARLLGTSGALDTATFGSSLGYVQLVTTTYTANTGTGIAIQSSKKIVCCGTSSTSEMLLLRLQFDGTFDTTFGLLAEGVHNVSFSTSAFAFDLALLPDQKIIVAGEADVNSGDFAIAKFTQNGSPDPTFTPQLDSTTLGEQPIDIGTTTIDSARGVAIQADGKIVAVGISADNFALARLDNTIEASPGSYDATFNDTVFANEGKVKTDFVGITDLRYNDVTINAHEQIIAVGTADSDMAIVRYELGGAIDSTFGTTLPGLTLIDGSGTGDLDAGNAIVMQPDGKIVVVGSTDNVGLSAPFFIVRMNSDGTLDTTFSADGKAFCDFGSSDQDVARAVGLQSNGKIIVAGTARDGAIAAEHNFGITRINVDGTLDGGFGTVTEAGKVSIDIGTLLSSPSLIDDGNALAIQSDDKVLVAGTTGTGASSNFAVVRLTSAGLIDTTFGSGTGAFVQDSTGAAIVDECNAVAVDADGKILLAGGSGDPNFIVVMRILADGSALDTTFNSGGTVPGILRFGLSGDSTPVPYQTANKIIVQNDGKLLVAGTYDFEFTADGNNDLFVFRLNSDGSLDTTFGTNGIKTANCGNIETGNSMALKADGTIVVVGDSDTDGLVVQLNNTVSAVTSTLELKKAFCFGDCGSYILGCRDGHRVLISRKRNGTIVESPILTKRDLAVTSTIKVDATLFATITNSCPPSITC